MYKWMLILQILLIVLFVLFSLFWFIIHGSGHNIPLKTELKFGIVDLVLASLTIGAFYLGNKRN